MATVTKKVCDAEVCTHPKRDEARTFSFFADRRADGAGGMENWYWKFDLCPGHQGVVLSTLLEKFDRNTAKISIQDMTNTLRELKVHVREE